MDAAAALGAREAGDLAGALALALRAWRRTRSPEIAEAARALDAELRAAQEPAKASRKDEFQRLWLGRDEADRSEAATGWLAANLGRMLPVAGETNGILQRGYAERKYAAALKRVSALAHRGADPRSARALLDWVRDPPFGVFDLEAAKLVYRPILDALVEAGDPGCVPALQELIAEPRATGAAVRDVLAQELPGAIGRLRALPVAALDEAEREAWRTLAGARPAAGSEEGEALLAKVLAAPGDDALRLVYADWLQERGDPRGELIVLQVREARGEATEAERKRSRALLRANKEAWLGDLARVLRGVELERGFLARAELAQNAAATEPAWRKAAADPLLATLEELRIGRGNVDHYELFVFSAQARLLRRIEVPRPRLLDALLEGRCPGPLEHLSLKVAPGRKQLDRFADRLGTVRSLQIGVTRPKVLKLLADLRASGVLARLQSLALAIAGVQQTADLVPPNWEEMPATLERLAVVGPLCAVELCREAEGVEAWCRGSAVADATTFVRILPDGVTALHLEPRGLPVRFERSLLEELAARRRVRVVWHGDAA